GRPARSTTTSALWPAWFIRYAAAARWPPVSTVVTAGRITSPTARPEGGCLAGSDARGSMIPPANGPESGVHTCAPQPPAINPTLHHASALTLAGTLRGHITHTR